MIGPKRVRGAKIAVVPGHPGEHVSFLCITLGLVDSTSIFAAAHSRETLCCERKLFFLLSGASDLLHP